MAAQVDLPPLAALAAMYVGFSASAWLMVLCPLALLFGQAPMTAGGCGYGNSAFHCGKGDIMSRKRYAVREGERYEQAA